MSDAHREELLLELDIPDGVPEAEEAVELIRAWVADGALVVTLNGEAFGDGLQDWGRLLAEIGRHIARASSLNGGNDGERLARGHSQKLRRHGFR